MKTNVIQFPQRIQENERVLFTLYGMSDGHLLEKLKDSPWTADELLDVVRSIREFARHLETKINEKLGEETDECLVEVRVYESGCVVSWASERIECQAQADWARGQLAKANIAFRDQEDTQ